MQYLYDSGFDVFHTILAGHMCSGKHWPQTKLAAAYGGESVGQNIAQDAELMGMIGKVNSNPGLTPQLLTRLSEKNPDFEHILSAQTYMAPLDKDEDPNFSQFFDSQHREYATEGTAQLRLVDAPPGPVYVTGSSLGGSVAIAVAA